MCNDAAIRGFPSKDRTMRTSSPSLRPRHRQGFGTRHSPYGPIANAVRPLKHWFRHATDRSIGAQLCDLRLNPFLFLTESGC